jgi:hypothetical protein
MLVSTIDSSIRVAPDEPIMPARETVGQVLAGSLRVSQTSPGGRTRRQGLRERHDPQKRRHATAPCGICGKDGVDG